jgi:hypothetical protein
VPFAAYAGRPPNQAHQRISRFLSGGSGARLVISAGAVYFPRGNAGEPDARALGAPDRPIAVPDASWSTIEGLAGRNDSSRGEEQTHNVAERKNASFFMSKPFAPSPRYKF